MVFNMDAIATAQDITLILGDCLTEMRKMPDKSIDLCLTDPLLFIFKFHVARLTKGDKIR